ncbi:MAG: nucleotidyltransferase domain-containing protein [Candidatus Thermoplasmatota archaeon]|nr:nucleotidyltransferase domain-containing protein [Candidatus Thermoplasmatota archaeon]
MTHAFDKKLLKKQISQILNQKEGVLFAYLFGSRARNTQSNQSDVDVAVYLSNEILKENKFYPEHLARDIEKTINISVDVRFT